jgi:hypothetical protein
MMRRSFLVVMTIGAMAIGACGDPEAEGRAAAQQRAVIETKREMAISAAKKVHPPVPGRQKLPCTQVINAEAFQTALGEVEPVTVNENTASDFEATAVCGVVRGGIRPSQEEQAKLLKKQARLGTLPGDEICSVSVYCWTIEEGPKFLERCRAQGFREDSSLMGTPACVQVVAQGADDVWVFKFFDEDTKCLLKARGGPSMIDNEVIAKCAQTARDTIGPAQIAVGGAAPAAPTAPADPSVPSAGSTY